MTINEKHRTEYKLIDQAINEMTRVMQRLATLEAAAEENRSTSEGLRKSEAMYRKVIGYLPQRIYFKDTHLAYVFCNDSYARDLNIRQEDIAGKIDYDFYPDELAGKIAEEETEILRTGVERQTEDTYRVSGKELKVLVTRNLVRNDEGLIVGLLVVLDNITEEKSREEKQASRLKNLEEMLAQRESKMNTVAMALEKMTAQRNQLGGEIKDLEGKMEKQMALHVAEMEKLMALHVAETEKLKNDLLREMTEKKDAVDLLRKSFTQIQDLMNSVHYAFKEEGSLKP